MADLQQFNQLRVVDANGEPVAGALAYFYAPGTLSPIDVFADEALTILHENPLEADGAGIFPQVWSADVVKVNVTTAAGATLPGYPLDPAFRSFGGLSGASTISFAPLDGWPADTVQAAIELTMERLNRYASLGLPLTVTSTDLNVLYSNAKQTTNWNTITGSGFWWSGATATNEPVDGVSFAAVSIQIDADTMTVIGTRVSSDQIFLRRKIGGVWQNWVQLAAMSDVNSAAAAALGVAQAWGAPSRSAGTSYQNTTGKPIMVAITVPDDTQLVEVSVDNVGWLVIANGGGTGGGETNTISFIVPPNHYYRCGTFDRWRELR